MAAAMRASMAMHRQEDRGAVQERTATKHCREDRMAPKHSREERTAPKHSREDRTAPKHCREDRAERTEPEDHRHRTGNISTTRKPPGEKGLLCCQLCKYY